MTADAVAASLLAAPKPNEGGWEAPLSFYSTRTVAHSATATVGAVGVDRGINITGDTGSAVDMLTGADTTITGIKL